MYNHYMILRVEMRSSGLKDNMIGSARSFSSACNLALGWNSTTQRECGNGQQAAISTNNPPMASAYGTGQTVDARSLIVLGWTSVSTDMIYL